jgi:hypothetical protein
MRPGNARSTPTWLVFDDEALNLLGRYYAPSNGVMRFDEIACAQQARGTILHKTVARYVIFVTRRGTIVRLATKHADAVVEILRSHGVRVHEDVLVHSNVAFKSWLGTCRPHGT